MSLKETYRIIHCKVYNSYRQMSDQYWHVECFKPRWWSLGHKMWTVETQSMWSSGGEFHVPLRFDSEEGAFDYIGRVSQKIPKDTTVKEPVKSFI